MLVIPSTSAAQTWANARSRINAAQARLQAGDYGAARDEYLQVFGMSPTTADVRDAYFGAAFAGQMLIKAGGQDANITIDRVASEYEFALANAGNQIQRNIIRNRGILYRDAGRHDAAIAEFTRLIGLQGVGATSAADRANALWNIGLSLEAMSRFGEANRAFSDALRADSTFADARRARLSLAMRLGAIDTTLSLAQAFRADSALAPQITEALLRILERPPAEIMERQVDRAMEEFVWNLVVRETGPDFFLTSLDARLREILTRSPATQKGLVAVGQAFTWRPDAPYQMTEATNWWRNNSGPDGRHAAWCALLRNIGDQLRQRPGSLLRARAYYEAALFTSDNQLHEWHDRGALEPLGVIYARTRDTAQAERLDRLVEQETTVELSQAVDSSKMKKLVTLHDYHATLGRIYSQGPDSASSGARRAEKHVESIRKIGDKIETTGRPRPLPPSDLLIDVAKRADARGDVLTARTITDDLSKSLTVRGREDLARAAADLVKLGSGSVTGRGSVGGGGGISPLSGVTNDPLLTRRNVAIGARFESLTRLDSIQQDSLRLVMNGVTALLNRAGRDRRFRGALRGWSSQLDSLATEARQTLPAITAEVWRQVEQHIATASASMNDGSTRAAEEAVGSLQRRLDDRHQKLRSIRNATDALGNRIAAAMR